MIPLFAAAPPLSGFPEFSSRDLEEVRHHIGALFTPHHLKVVGGGQRLDASVRAVQLGEISLVYDRHGADVHIDPEKLGDFFLLQLPISGTARVRVDGQERGYAPGQACLISPSVGVEMFFPRNCEHINARIEQRAFHAWLEQTTQRSLTRDLVFEPFVDLDTGQGAGLASLLRYILATCENNHALLLRPQVQRQISHLLMNTLAFSIENNYKEALTHDGAARLPYPIKRARSFIHENLKTAITPMDIAAFARVSVRSVFAGFRTYLGTSPMSYLRDLRLQAVHELLSRHAAGRISITDVAVDYGFFHFGHFAASYRAKFGELPSETLKRTLLESTAR